MILIGGFKKLAFPVRTIQLTAYAGRYWNQDNIYVRLSGKKQLYKIYASSQVVRNSSFDIDASVGIVILLPVSSCI